MITISQYFIGRPHTDEQEQAADKLLTLVNTLIVRYETETGRPVNTNPMTHSQISGVTEGGFREINCTQGAWYSSHKVLRGADGGAGVDVFDPLNLLDHWINDDILEECDLYREHPDKTIGWCHLTDRSPPSGKRTFYP
jgi:hypothetical protein